MQAITGSSFYDFYNHPHSAAARKIIVRVLLVGEKTEVSVYTYTLASYTLLTHLLIIISLRIENYGIVLEKIFLSDLVVGTSG